jgi:hypothetical protein
MPCCNTGCVIFKLKSTEGNERHSTSKEDNNNIVNFSKTALTADAKQLLNKGLSFIPAPQISATPILEAANVFSRRLKLHNYFNNLNRGRNSYQKTPFTGKSNWSPPDSRIDPDLLNCISDFTEETSKLDPKAEKNNMSAEEKRALKELQNNSDLVFKKADKGSAIVVMDKKDYLFEGYRQLDNPHDYKPLENLIYPETAEEITTILKGLKDSFQISEKQYNYLENVLGPVDSTHCLKFIKLQKAGQCQVKFRQGDPLYLIAIVSRKKIHNILMPF